MSVIHYRYIDRRIACGDPGQHMRDLPPTTTETTLEVTCPLCARALGHHGIVENWRRLISDNRRLHDT